MWHPFSELMPPIPRDKYWSETNLGDIDPLIARKLSGRPKKKTFQENGEGNETNLSRKCSNMKYQICFKLDHNSITCPKKKKRCQQWS